MRLGALRFGAQVIDMLRTGWGRRPVVHSGRRVESAFVAGAGALEVELELAAGARLHLDAAVRGPGALRLAVVATADGRTRTLWSRYLRSESGWEHASLPLDDLAGGRARLSFRSTPDGDSREEPAVALWGDPVVRAGDAPRRPPVVLYVVDTLRADHVESGNAPAFARLARESVVFERCIAQGNWTAASVPSLHTSTAPAVHGVPHRRATVASELPTLAEELRDAGYLTASFVTNRLAGPGTGLERGFSVLVDATREAWGDPAPRRTLPDEALRWIEEHRDEPLFVHVHTAEPHHPYTPPPGLRPPGPRAPIDWAALDTTRVPDEPGRLRALYAGEVRAAERGLARLVRLLRALELFDDTLLVLTSDHGESFGEHGGWGHGSGLWQHQVHVPLIVHLPRGARAGERVTSTVRSIDVAPTVLGRLGLPAPAHAAGVDLFARPWADLPALSEDLRGPCPERALQAGPWKVVLARGEDGGERLEAFSLDDDPLERRPLLEPLPAPVRELARELRALPLEPAARRVPEVEHDPADLADLRELGYVDGR